MVLGAAALPLALRMSPPVLAQDAAKPLSSLQVPPILFVHGNGDHAALWMTLLWRMESNGIARDRMMAINFTDPLARADDTVAQPDRTAASGSATRSTPSRPMPTGAGDRRGSNRLGRWRSS
jgi:hypothetical protein